VLSRHACALLDRRGAWGEFSGLPRLPLGIAAALVAGVRCARLGPSAVLSQRVIDHRRARRCPRRPPTGLAWFFVALTRALFGQRECLFEAVVLSSALRKMGFDARIVIGHVFAPSSFTDSPMHAWVELGGEAVTLYDRGNDVLFTRVMEFPLTSA
jgi:hypothetical protein